MRNWKILLLSGIPLLMVGCVTYRKDFTENALDRVSFEMKCPKEQIQLTGLTGPIDQSMMALGTGGQVGVQGCGQRAVYVRTDAGWLLNSNAKSDGPSDSQAAAPKSPAM